MRNLYLSVLSIVLVGCATLQTINRPSETIPNPKCEDIPALEVFQVLDKFVLANTCENKSYGMFCSFPVVYVEKEKGKIYYDDQKIIPSADQCFEYVGTYKYTTKAESEKVVPKAKLVSSKIANPEYELWKKEQEQNKK